MLGKYKLLSEKYRRNKKLNKLLTDAEKQAYLQARMPATRAVTQRVLQEALRLMDLTRCTSFLDLCAGPGTASLVVADLLPIKIFTLIEQDPGWASHSNKNFNYIWTSLDRDFKTEPHDIALLSYGLNEMAEEVIDAVIEKCWQFAKQALILIEPGTPLGYARVMQARKRLIELGASIVAPCPHALQCPMEGSAKWCHFSQRLERTRAHRLAKGAALGYEDEKFSYLIVSRQLSPSSVKARIVGHPRLVHAGLSVELCTPAGLERKTLLKSDRERYKRVKKLAWGEGYHE